MLKRPLPLIICAAVLVGSSWFHGADARPVRVALTKLAGDSNGVGRVVADALDDGSVVFVPATRIERAIDRLGLDRRLSDRDVHRLADELEVDAVIRSAYDRKSRRVRFTIFADGKKGKPFAVQARNTRSEKFRTAVHDVVMARVAAMVPPESRRLARKAARPKPEPDSDPAAPSRPSAPAGDPATDAAPDSDDGPVEEPAAAPAKQVAARDGDEPEEVVSDGIDRAGGRERPASFAAVRADLGVSVMARKLTYASSSPNPPRRYRNGAVPGGRFEAEIYPFALADSRGWLTDLGVAGDFDQTIGLKVPSPEAGAALATTVRRYSIGLCYRFALGDTPTGPTLTVGAGYGAQTFAFDRASLMAPSALEVPDVDYRLVHAGGAFRLPLGDRFTATLAARGLFVLNSGPLQRPDQYGTATLYGGATALGVEALLTHRIALRIAGEATLLRITFTGNGAISSAREVSAAADSYVGGSATLVLVY